MKLIHCADIHLDSPLREVADGNARRNEILLAFCDMVEYAFNNQIQFVLIAGDLFDSDFVSQSTFLSLLDIFNKYKNINYFILRGNHGGKKAYQNLAQQKLPNLHFFENQSFTTYDFEQITISGCELEGNDSEKYRTLNLPKEKFNIVMLHADIDTSNYGTVDLKALENAGTNYLAMGHRHSCSQKKLGKMKIVYSGVLETRGFDEKEPTGFVLLDTDQNTVKFIPQFRRKVTSVVVDLTGKTSNISVLDAVTEALRGKNPADYIDITLTGTLPESVSIDLLKDSLKGRFFALRVENKTSLTVDIESLSKEISLKGEFLKLAMQISDENLKKDIVKLGLNALDGEEVCL